jgi:hypothetical protein
VLLEAIAINDHAKGVFGVGAIQPASAAEAASEAAPSPLAEPATEPVTEPVTERGATDAATGAGASSDSWLRLDFLLASTGGGGGWRPDSRQHPEVPRG